MITLVEIVKFEKWGLFMKISQAFLRDLEDFYAKSASIFAASAAFD